MFFDVQTILMQLKGKFTDYFLCKMQSNGKYRVYLGLCKVAMETKFMLEVQLFRSWKLLHVVTPPSKNWH